MYKTKIKSRVEICQEVWKTNYYVMRFITCHVSHLSDSDRHRQRSQLLVEGDQHTWLHGCYQAVEYVVRLPQNNCNTHSEHKGTALTIRK